MSIQLAKNSLELGLRRCLTPGALIQIRNYPAQNRRAEIEPKSLMKLIEVKEELKKPGIKKSITVEAQDDVSAISGVPVEHVKERLIRIYRTPKNAMQSGTDNVDVWELEFETRERWENSLMGWCSSGDPLSNMKLTFDDVDSAIRFASKNGFEYYIDSGKAEKSKVKSYGFNFSWNKRTRVSTK